MFNVIFYNYQWLFEHRVYSKPHQGPPADTKLSPCYSETPRTPHCSATTAHRPAVAGEHFYCRCAGSSALQWTDHLSLNFAVVAPPLRDTVASYDAKQRTNIAHTQMA